MRCKLFIDKRGMGTRERSALAKVLKPLKREVGICRVGYDKHYDVFFFGRRSSVGRDVNRGQVLSVSDARHGAWRTIFEPPNF